MKTDDVRMDADAGSNLPADLPSGLYLRVVQASVRVVVKRDGKGDAVGTPEIRRLLRQVGAYLEADTAPQTTLERLETLVEQQAVGTASLATWSDLAAGIGKAFSFTPAEQALFELALHANRSRELQRALNVAGEMDDVEAAGLFAELLDVEQDAVLSALRKPDPFRRLNGYDLQQTHAVPFAYLRFRAVVTEVVRTQPTIDGLLALFCRPSPRPRLSLSDFPHHEADISLLRRYIECACAAGRPAVNILLHGAPGTGKTELVRALAADLGSVLVEIPSMDEDKDPLPPWRRLTALTATQDIMRTRTSSLVLFDEVEDVFPVDTGMPGLRTRGQSSGDRNKGWLTQLLEENPRPTFWVCNQIGHIDLAFIRRFDLVLELATPPPDLRERMVESFFEGLPLKADALSALKRESALVPAHLERIAGVLRAMGPANEDDAGVILSVLERQTLKTLDLPARRASSAPCLPYRPDCINTSVDLAALVPALQRHPSARLCLFGPPGTGKTEWARHLASRLGRPLHVKRASDLLGMFVGQSERLIRSAFDVAAQEGAVLLIDEADGLLRNRAGAGQDWETRLVNEMLTSMEGFEGVFVASTNLQEALDPASARRFDFKVRFDALAPTQIRRLFDDLLEALGLEVERSKELDLNSLAGTTPGDFANVLRQCRLLDHLTSPRRVLDLLLGELGTREATAGRRIGFV